MKKIVTFIIALLSFTVMVFAEGGDTSTKPKTSSTTEMVEISVIDTNTDEELVGVTVDINDKKYYTNFDGIVSIPKIELTDSVTFSLISYEDKIEKIENSGSVKLNPHQ